jgi:hypothetical protein
MQILNLPFHHFNTRKEKWRYVLTSVLFFIFFLLIYQPFGIYAEAEEEKFSALEFIGLLFSIATVVFLVLCVSQFILRKRFAPSEFNLKFFLKWFLIDIVCIVIIMAIVEFFLFEDDIITIDNVLKEVVFGIVATFFVLFFILLYPVVGILAFVHLKKLHNDKKELEKDLSVVSAHYKIASGNQELVKIVDEKGICKLTVSVSNLFIIESKNQYVSIRYRRNDRIVEQCIRARFSVIFESLTKFPTMLRCHRSYAINLMNVETLKFIDHKPTLILDASETLKIPVSKTYLKEIKAKLSEY